MFHKDLYTATKSAAILPTAREMMYFTKTNLKGSYFRFASPPTTESPGRDHFKQLPTPGPEELELSLCLPEGVVTSLIELCMNDILENRKPLFPG